MLSNLPVINQYFDHVYVLNLSRRMDRKVCMVQKLNHLNIKAEFFTAVDGYTPECKKEYEAYFNIPLCQPNAHPLEKFLKMKVITSPGAWGYLKTFSNILKDAKKRKFQRILCFDDDVLFHKDFENRFVELTKNISNHWKLLYLGASQQHWAIPDNLSFPDKNKTKIDKNASYYFPVYTDGSFALGIQSSIFDELLQSISKMDCSFDSGPLMDIVKKYPKACLVAFPNLVIADLSESNIRGAIDFFKWSKNYKWHLKDYNFSFQDKNYQIGISQEINYQIDLIKKQYYKIKHKIYRILNKLNLL